MNFTETLSLCDVSFLLVNLYFISLNNALLWARLLYIYIYIYSVCVVCVCVCVLWVRHFWNLKHFLLHEQHRIFFFRRYFLGPYCSLYLVKASSLVCGRFFAATLTCRSVFSCCLTVFRREPMQFQILIIGVNNKYFFLCKFILY